MSTLLLQKHPCDEKASPNDSAPDIICRIAEHAASTPDREAIVHGSHVLSWADLDARSDKFAACLRQRGVQSESCIALLLERSPRFVAAALAVLKAGAAYLPLDVGTPDERLDYILADSGAQLLLTERDLVRRPSNPRCYLLDVADLLAAQENPSAAAPPRERSPDSLAYVIYTSGSTGLPKGVEITWGNLLNLIQWHQRAFGVTAADRASQVARLAFDAAVWEIWPTLAAGACLHILDDRTSRSATALRDHLLADKITIAFAPTLLAEQLLLMDWPADTALRVLLTGADTLHRHPPAELPFTLVNNYGPTECTVVATSCVVASSDGGPPSIGRAIENAAVAILDENQRPVPPGEPGELCLAGTLVGRGYRNNPQLTAERFIHCPLTPGGKLVRLYRTGDRARLLPGGEIAFLGRLDEQVKIRGYRVELREIVTWLDRFPGIMASAAALQNTADGPVLVAYVVLTADARQNDLAASDLRAFLASRLPDYMVPAAFVSLAALPVTPNGKLDRAALPPPTKDNMLPEATAPATEPAPNRAAGIEAQLAEMVASLVGRPVSHEEDFFLVGGHSMLGVQLLSRIRDQFGVKLALRQLFSTPTVAGLSAEISRQLSKPHETRA